MLPAQPSPVLLDRISKFRDFPKGLKPPGSLAASPSKYQNTFQRGIHGRLLGRVVFGWAEFGHVVVLGWDNCIGSRTSEGTLE